MIFETKKIQIETLSEYLSAVRANLNFSPVEVCKKTGISIKFLNALESGNLKILPADVYVYGFLRQLAQLYIIDQNILIEQYKKERGIESQIAKASKDSSSVIDGKFFGKLVITPKVLSFIFGAVFVTITILYIIWQVWSINKTPSLQIFSPENNAVISSSFVDVKGQTDPGMSVTVNDQIVFVDNKGNFQTQLGLSAGAKEISIVAKNRFDKVNSKVLNITGSASNTTIDSQRLELKVDFNSNVVLGFGIDDQPTQTLNFSKGDSKIFTATKQILLSTTDAGATKVTLNGQLLGPMGRAGETLNNVSFFAQASSTTTPASP